VSARRTEETLSQKVQIKTHVAYPSEGKDAGVIIEGSPILGDRGGDRNEQKKKIQDGTTT